MGCGQTYLGPLIVGSRRPYSTHGIAIDGESRNVDHATADTLVRFTFPPHTERQRVTLELIRVKAADAVAIADARQVDEIH